MSVKILQQQRRMILSLYVVIFHMYPEPAWLEYRSAF